MVMYNAHSAVNKSLQILFEIFMVIMLACNSCHPINFTCPQVLLQFVYRKVSQLVCEGNTM